MAELDNTEQFKLDASQAIAEFARLAASTEKLNQKNKDLSKSLSLLNNSAGKANTSMNDLRKEVNSIVSRMSKLADNLSEANKNFKSLNAQMAKAASTAATTTTIINNLSNAYTTLGGTTNNYNTHLSNLGNTVNSGNTRMSNFGNTVTRITNIVNQANPQIAKATRGIGLSFSDLTRILLVQFIHSGIGSFINAIKQAVVETEKFETKISEIRTISQDSQRSFQDWSSDVKRLSDEFGNPVLDVAEGLYQTISNQIAKGAEATQFLTKALEFGRVTQASTAESVALLSSAINAFKLEVSDTDRISSIFFRTIELGRLRASDIADTFGRVGPIANALGVNIDEVGAAIATITINGVPAKESMVLINNVMKELLNPGKEMKKVLADIGVESGRAAISTFGFAGTFRKLEEATRGSDTELARMFPDMRSLRGALSLTGDSLSDFEANLTKIQDRKPFDIAKQIITESSGKRLEIEFNKIHNYFLSFGQSIAELALSWTKTTNAAGFEVDGIAKAMQGLVHWTTVAVTTMIGYRAATMAVNALLTHQAVLAAAAKSGVPAPSLGSRFVASGGVPILAATAATAILIGIYEAEQFRIDKLRRDYQELNEFIIKDTARVTDALSRQIDDRSERLKKGIDDQFKLYFSFAADTNKLYNEMGEGFKKANKDMAGYIKDVFDLQLKELRANISDLEKQASQALSNIEKSQNRIIDRKESLTRDAFDQAVKGLPLDQQAAALKARADALEKSAAARLSDPANAQDSHYADENARLAEKEQADADKYRNEALAKRIDLNQKVISTEEKIAEIKQRQADHDANADLKDDIPGRKGGTREQRARYFAEQSLQEEKRDQQIRKDAEELTLLEKKLVLEKKARDGYGDEAKILKEIKAIKDARNALDATFQKNQKAIHDRSQKEAEDQKKRLEEIQTIFSQIAKFKLDQENINKIAGGSAPKESATADFDSAVQRLKDLGLTDPQTLLALQQQKALILIELDAAIKDKVNKNAVVDLENGKKDLQEKRKQLDDEAKKSNEAQGAVETKLKGIVATFTAFSNNNKGVMGPDMAGLDPGINNLSNLIRQYISDLKSGKRDATGQTPGFLEIQSEITRLGKLIDKSSNTGYWNAYGGQTQTNLTGEKNATDPKTFVDLLGDLLDAKQAAEKIAKETAERQVKETLYDNQLNALNIRLAQTVGAQTAANNALVTFTTTLQDTARKISTAFTDLDKSRTELEKIKRDHPELQLAMGGTVGSYGIFTSRGTDTVPAMLSPGEFVVRESMARKYRDTLLNINAGYYAEGGDVRGPRASFSNLQSNSVQVGDINIDIQTQNVVPSQTAKELGRELEKELYRGTLNFRNRR